jgi:hypothetical protein
MGGRMDCKNHSAQLQGHFIVCEECGEILSQQKFAIGRHYRIVHRVYKDEKKERDFQVAFIDKGGRIYGYVNGNDHISLQWVFTAAGIYRSGYYYLEPK